MPEQNTASRIVPEKPDTTLREAVVRRIGQFFDLYGLDTAMEKFDDMKALFSGIQGWPDIEEEVTAFFIEKRREQQQADIERQQHLEEMWIEAVAKNGVKQANLLTGRQAQAPFYSSTPTIGGHKQ